MEEKEDSTAGNILISISEIANSDSNKASKKIKEIQRLVNKYIDGTYMLSTPVKKQRD